MNPALPVLLRAFAAARVRRFRLAFTSRRRVLLSLAAVLLSIVWLGQTLSAALLRDPYDPVALQTWMTHVLAAYFCWHVVRVIWKRPEEAIEWSDGEQEQIAGGPFTRRDVLTWRFIVIFTSTLPKALVTAIVLFPDLWWTGLPGLVLALVFLECSRMAIDMASCCLSPRIWQTVRFSVAGLLIAGAASLGVSESSVAIAWLPVVESPFVTFSDVITAQAFSGTLITDALLLALMIFGVVLLIIRLDAVHQRILIERAADCSRNREAIVFPQEDSSTVRPLPRVPALAAIGPLAWRQLKSAGQHPGSLVVALALPAVLSCLPLLAFDSSYIAFLSVVASVFFYSSVLLPEAVKFDFRLDSDHLARLKMLPISPSRLAVGQMATPVLLTTAFQWTVFLFAGLVRPIPPDLVANAMLLAVPVNLFFVALDNLIFLLYPHRPTQEGLEAFLRSILKLTFKMILLTIAALLIENWSVTARLLADTLGTSQNVQLIFVLGAFGFVTLTAALTINFVAQAFDRFDISVNVPA